MDVALQDGSLLRGVQPHTLRLAPSETHSQLNYCRRIGKHAYFVLSHGSSAGIFRVDSMSPWQPIDEYLHQHDGHTILQLPGKFKEDLYNLNCSILLMLFNRSWIEYEFTTLQ